MSRTGKTLCGTMLFLFGASIAWAENVMPPPTGQGPGWISFVPAPVPPAGSRAALAAQVKTEARLLGVPPDLADTVAEIETGYTPDVTGSAGEIGLMQILPSTARLLGFAGPENTLFDPEMNMRYAVRYLALAWGQSHGNLCRALTKYRAGLAEERYSPLSVAYCARGLAYLRQIKSPLAASENAFLPAADWRIGDGAAGLWPTLWRGQTLPVTELAFGEQHDSKIVFAAKTYVPPSAGTAIAVPGSDSGVMMVFTSRPLLRQVSQTRHAAQPRAAYVITLPDSD
jgi:hypothetical protein